MKNSSLATADLMTHLKILVVSLIAALGVVLVGLYGSASARTDNASYVTTSRV